MTGRIAVITGGAKGIGEAAAVRFLEENIEKVILLDIDEARVNETAKKLDETGTRVFAYKCNIADYDDTERVFAQINERFGRVDILVNNAGVVRDRCYSAEDNDQVFKPHLFRRPLHAANRRKRCKAHVNITREECDECAARSQRIAALGCEEGLYPEHILPITVPMKKSDPVTVTRDEMLRTSTVETLAKLKPVLGGVVTAGNSSPLNDGASAGVIMEEEKARAMGLKPLLRFVDYAVAGVDHRYMGLGPVGAMKKAARTQ